MNISSERTSRREGLLIALLKSLNAERRGFEPRQHLRVDRLAICSITTLAPLLYYIKNLRNKIAVANVIYMNIERNYFFTFLNILFWVLNS